MEKVINSEEWVVQFCHGYGGPFMDCARQYAALFKETKYKVCTVYLTGDPNDVVANGSASDDVVFLNYTSQQVRGLKLSAIRGFKRLLAQRNYTVCIAHRFKPIYIALFASKLPVIGVHHAFGDYNRRSRKRMAYAYRKRLRLLGVSNAVRNDMRASLTNFNPDYIQTLYNRINVAAVQAEQVDREQAREHLKLPQQAWVIGNVGRLHPDKDQTTLIKGFAKALPQLPNGSLLVIMGSGKLEKELKQLTTDLEVGQSVHFLGQVENGRRYFKAFDIFALTSDHEPFGMVLLEAMAAGNELIVSNCGGAPEVVGDYGQKFPLGDAETFARILTDLSLSHEKQTSLQLQLLNQLKQKFSDQVQKRIFFDYWRVFDMQTRHKD